MDEDPKVEEEKPMEIQEVEEEDEFLVKMDD